MDNPLPPLDARERYRFAAMVLAGWQFRPQLHDGYYFAVTPQGNPVSWGPLTHVIDQAWRFLGGNGDA